MNRWGLRARSTSPSQRCARLMSVLLGFSGSFTCTMCSNSRKLFLGIATSVFESVKRQSPRFNLTQHFVCGPVEFKRRDGGITILIGVGVVRGFERSVTDVSCLELTDLAVCAREFVRRK